jgi:7,8-dihydroneopterin aldolase/epimerase/oxygenase
MTYITTINDLEFFAHHGVYAEEQVLGAIFKVDITVKRELTKPIETLDEATNYELIYGAAKQAMSKPEALIETVAQNILKNLQNYFTEAQITVTIHKPNPAGLFKSGVASVTVLNY